MYRCISSEAPRGSQLVKVPRNNLLCRIFAYNVIHQCSSSAGCVHVSARENCLMEQILVADLTSLLLLMGWCAVKSGRMLFHQRRTPRRAGAAVVASKRKGTGPSFEGIHTVLCKLLENGPEYSGEVSKFHESQRGDPLAPAFFMSGSAKTSLSCRWVVQHWIHKRMQSLMGDVIERLRLSQHCQ